MPQWQGRSKVKYTGGRLKRFSAKKKRELGRPAAETAVGGKRVRSIRTRGGSAKRRLLRDTMASVKTLEGKIVRIPIRAVLDNPANKDFARRRIITKGALIDTEHGHARVTSRPGQYGVINAVVIED